MQRSLALVLLSVLLCVALVAGAYLFLGQANSKGAAARPLQLSDAAQTPLAPVAELSPAEARSQQGAAEPAAAAARAEVGAREAASKPLREIEVALVTVGAGEPPPGATVRYVQHGKQDGSPFRSEAWKLETIDAYMRKHAVPVVANAQGLVRLPQAEDCDLLLYAQAGDYCGRLRIRPKDQGPLDPDLGQPGPLVLRMQFDGDLRVRVLGPDGTALSGAIVALWAVRGGWDDERVRVETAGHPPLALLAHVGLRVDPDETDDFQLKVGLVGLYRTRPVLELDLQALPKEEIVLRQPGVCGLDVRLVATDAHPVPAQGSVELRYQSLPKAGFSAGPEQWSSIHAEIEDGWAHFDGIEPGLELTAVLNPRALTGTEITTKLVAPASAGSRGSFDFVLSPAQPVLQVRLLDSEGQVLSKRPISCSMGNGEERDWGGFGLRQTTDEQGLLMLGLRLSFEPGSQPWVEFGYDPGKGQTALSSRLELPAGLLPGLQDLGDVRLQAAPLIASGRVVDEQGNGRKNVKVRAIGLLVNTQADGSEYVEAQWQSMSDTSTDEQGLFVLRGRFPEPRARVSASSKGLVEVNLDVPIGSRELLLELRGGARVEGRLIADAGLDLESFSVKLVSSAGLQPGSGDEAQTRASKSGKFKLLGLREGSFALEVLIEGAPRALLRLEGLGLVGGQACADERLNPIDVRGLARMLRVELLVPQGGELPSGQYSLRAMDQEQPFQHSWFQGKSIEFLAAKQPLKLRLSPEGYRDVELTLDEPLTRVQLRRALQVRLHVETGLAADEFRGRLFVRSSTEEGSGGWNWDLGSGDESGDFHLELSNPGVHQLRFKWFVPEVQPDWDGDGSYHTLEVEQHSIEVFDSEAEQYLEIKLDTESLRQQLRAIAAPIEQPQDG